MVSSPPGPSSFRLPATILAAWLAAALVLGASGRLAALQPPGPQLLVLTLTGLGFLAVSKTEIGRRWADGLSLRILVSFHLIRFVGAYFLILVAKGELPAGFGIPAGWGDLAVAFTALLLLAGARPGAPRGRRLYLLWNAFGLLDILFVVATAMRIALQDQQSMVALLQLPLSLLPTFLVPLIIVSHLVMLRRLRAAPARPVTPH